MNRYDRLDSTFVPDSYWHICCNHIRCCNVLAVLVDCGNISILGRNRDSLLGKMALPRLDLTEMLHHNHYCRHCDRNFTCQLDAKCLLEFDISKLHKCLEGLKYRKRMAIMLSSEQDTAPCAYGCSRVCSHPQKSEMETSKQVRAAVTQSAVNVPSGPASELSNESGTQTAIEPPAARLEAPVSKFDPFRGSREPTPTLSARERHTRAVIAMAKRG